MARHKIIDIDEGHVAEVFARRVNVRERDGSILYQLSGEFDVESIAATLHAYYRGHGDGVATGRAVLRAEFCELFGLKESTDAD